MSSAEQEIETQRRDAVKAALVMKRSFSAERAGLKKKLKSVKERESAMYNALERNGVSRAAFDEAAMRATQDQHDLDIFDTEAAEVETWIRDWLEDDKNKRPAAESEGPQLTPEEQQDIAEQNADAQADSESAIASEAEVSETDPDTVTTSDDGDPDGTPAAAVEFEDDPSATQADQPGEAEAAWDMGDAPAADPKAAEMTARVAPSAGAAGVSMDDIPMPQSQIHDLQQEQSKRKFVDRRERMTAAEYNEASKAG